MLPAKPWKIEAIVRLLLSVFICHFLGSLAISAGRFPHPNHPVSPWIFGALLAGSATFSLAALFILRRPWELSQFTRPFLWMIFCLYLGLTLGAFVQYFTGQADEGNPTVRTLVATLSFQGAALVFIWRFVREHRMQWREAFGFAVNWKKAAVLGLLVACAFLPLAMLLLKASAGLLTRLSVEPEVQPAVEALRHTATWLDRLALALVAVGLAPVAEELIFRGIVYPTIKQAGFPRAALWGTSVLFAAVHLNLATFVPLLALALLLVWLYEHTGNLLASIAAHSAFNALQFTLFYLLPVAAREFEWLRRFSVES